MMALQMSWETGLDWGRTRDQKGSGKVSSSEGAKHFYRERGKKGKKQADNEAWGTSLHEEVQTRAVAWFSQLKIPGLRTVTITPSKIC